MKNVLRFSLLCLSLGIGLLAADAAQAQPKKICKVGWHLDPKSDRCRPPRRGPAPPARIPSPPGPPRGRGASEPAAPAASAPQVSSRQ
ncbi:Rod shape-determining protein MreC [Paraburkholderia tropica]|uniref:hypothetical protein n=1 Tax=Paraburkholderia TaxID=1822464 RepID=UPI001CB38529|nr:MULTISPECIES: hypothetical protein [Paraburkholderia]CAG9200656.1 Rod shape-determining protein MreC [Paraburkholderia tropica]